jgi:hypothetical protein
LIEDEEEEEEEERAVDIASFDAFRINSKA